MSDENSLNSEITYVDCKEHEEGNKISFVDSHAHLTFPQFKKDLEDVCARSLDSGVNTIITIGSGDGIEGNKSAIKFANTKKWIYATVGVHPHDAKNFDSDSEKELASMLAEKKVVAVGETGLDYHYKHSTQKAQQECFRSQLRLANKFNLPIIIHDREAHNDVLNIIQEEGIPRRKGVFHCFSGNLSFAEKVIEAGFYVSFSGIVTFPNAKDMQALVSYLPLENMMIETDAPYLAPVPYRGKRNEPAFVSYIAKAIAEIKELDISDVARVTSLNARRLFNLPGFELESKIAYRIRNSLYLNVTNRCNLKCTFCPKFSDFEVKGHYLKLKSEPDVEQVFQALGHPERYDEVVFCGYGEPTLRLELIKEVARRMRSIGVSRIRLNTDGLASLVYGRNIPQELEGLIDAVSVSLNASDSSTYSKICPSKYGKTAYESVKKFIKDAKKFIPEVVATVVALPGLDVEACRKVVEDELKVKFKARKFMHMG